MTGPVGGLDPGATSTLVELTQGWTQDLIADARDDSRTAQKLAGARGRVACAVLLPYDTL